MVLAIKDQVYLYYCFTQFCDATARSHCIVQGGCYTCLLIHVTCLWHGCIAQDFSHHGCYAELGIKPTFFISFRVFELFLLWYRICLVIGFKSVVEFETLRPRSFIQKCYLYYLFLLSGSVTHCSLVSFWSEINVFRSLTHCLQIPFLHLVSQIRALIFCLCLLTRRRLLIFSCVIFLLFHSHDFTVHIVIFTWSDIFCFLFCY